MPPAINTGRFNHASLNTSDVARAVSFYGSVLGFREVPRPSFSFGGSWLYCEGLGMMLHLIHDERFPSPVESLETRRNHLAFRVDDIDQTRELLAAHQVEFVERKLPDFGYRQLFFHDPDRNVIELGEWPDVEQLVADSEQRLPPSK